MKSISMDKMVEKTGSLYKLCNMAALRAIELNSGAKKLVDAIDPKEKITSLAIREISEGKVMLAEVEGGE